MVGCPEPVLLSTLLLAIDDTRNPYALRTAAVGGFRNLQSPLATRALLSRGQRILFEAERTPLAQRLGRAFVSAISKRQHPQIQALLYRAAESRAPLVRAQAILDLSRSCSTRAKELIERGTQSSHRPVKQSALRAKETCLGPTPR